MPIVILLVGLILIVTAYKNTFGDLFSALKSDVPGFAKWFAAVALVGGLGYVPGLTVPSRYLLGLVLLVLFMANASKITAGFKDAASGASSGKAAQTDPASAFAANPTKPNITTASIQGTASSSSSGTSSAASATSTALAAVTNPSSVVSNYMQQSGVSQIFDASSMGFGGIG